MTVELTVGRTGLVLPSVLLGASRTSLLSCTPTDRKGAPGHVLETRKQRLETKNFTHGDADYQWESEILKQDLLNSQMYAFSRGK